MLGWCHNGELTTTKSSDLAGYLFVIPDEKYDELFKG